MSAFYLNLDTIHILWFYPAAAKLFIIVSGQRELPAEVQS